MLTAMAPCAKKMIKIKNTMASIPWHRADSEGLLFLKEFSIWQAWSDLFWKLYSHSAVLKVDSAAQCQQWFRPPPLCVTLVWHPRQAIRP